MALKICDPACGSASFLLAAVRFLLEALWQSLFYHGWLSEQGDKIVATIAPEEQPVWFTECVKNLPLTTEQAEERSKPRLKRVLVERCLYGVDINPLAVELARLALWVETMDQYLPFSFLDHKIKCGNALVGCWFDQFQDYPLMAWEREAGDKTHKGVHFAKEGWTKEIKRLRNAIVRDEMRAVLSGEVQLSLFEDRLLQSPDETHAELRSTIETIHSLALDPERQAEAYTEIEQNQALEVLKWAFNCWCAVWFWSGEAIETAPTPMRFVDPPDETVIAVEQLAQEYQFFHWELEFPDVFTGNGAGFGAIVGNPPWEIQKPNSKEFFSNIDPLYRTYGKQEALDYQQHYFEDATIESSWLRYCAKLKALSNWCKYVALPFGDREAGKFSLSRKKAENEVLHREWRTKREARSSYADRNHPFIHQGSADINTYKMFLELGHALLKAGGNLGLIVPSGLYSDKGATALRKLFLARCRWQWLFGFENRDRIFTAVDSRFKFCPVIVQKGGETTSIQTTFMERDVKVWQEIAPLTLAYPRSQVEQFSPYSKAILEIRTDRDLMILEKMYANGILLGDSSPQGWGIRYATEFHMTNDSRLFPPRPQWEAKGYRADEYGHWLKGNWREVEALSVELESSGLEHEALNLEADTLRFDGESLRLDDESSRLDGESLNLEGDTLRFDRESLDLEDDALRLDNESLNLENEQFRSALLAEGMIRSIDGRSIISIDEVEDVALPLYQGVMMNQFDACAKAWKNGAGFQAVWEPLAADQRTLSPQYLVSRSNYFESPKVSRHWKLGYRRIARTTDTRTWIGTLISDLPAGDSIFYLISDENKPVNSLNLAAILNSYVYDWQLRNRLVGTNLSWFVLEETTGINRSTFEKISCDQLVLRLIGTTLKHAVEWQFYQNQDKSLRSQHWKSLWAITPHERLRLRCILDAVVAHLYGLDPEDFAWILRDCDHPIERVNDKAIARTFDPKGFWRVDKDKPPELRHTVLSQVAFQELNAIGLEAFLTLNDGEGWMLPKTIRLADYGLGNSDRAHEFVPVAEKMGDRFLAWQLEGTPEDSWKECDRHAENLRLLLGNQPTAIDPPTAEPERFSDRQLTLLPDDTEQLNLFDRS